MTKRDDRATMLGYLSEITNLLQRQTDLASENHAVLMATWGKLGGPDDNLLSVIGDLLDERLPKPGEPCPCGCRRDVEGATTEERAARAVDQIRTDGTMTLDDVALVLRGLGDALETLANSRPGDDLRHSEPDVTPEPTEAVTSASGANLGRVGWLRIWSRGPWILAHEAEGGWSDDSTNSTTWDADEWPDAVFEPLPVMPPLTDDLVDRMLDAYYDNSVGVRTAGTAMRHALVTALGLTEAGK